MGIRRLFCYQKTSTKAHQIYSFNTVDMTTKPDSDFQMKTLTPVPCPVCGCSRALLDKEVYDDRYDHPDLFELVRCSDCGHLMVRPSLSESDLAHLYGTYYPRKNITSNSCKRFWCIR